jgi:fructose-1,6-bisphosphatase/inositol monophosphatase family enzyme
VRTDTSLTLRLDVARLATESVAEAILSLRGAVSSREAAGDQLKTPVDDAAEAWILGYLRHYFPDEHFLCEELFESEKKAWDAPPAYWTVDALDGTRSFAGGFDGFCVQVAYVEKGTVLIGLVVEPVRRTTYWAMKGGGAFSQTKGGEPEALRTAAGSWPAQPVFVDSTEPQGPVGEFKAAGDGRLLECGSIGLKICRVAEGRAHVYAKDLTFKLWDCAPGEVILREAGGRLGLWSGESIPYDTADVHFRRILATSNNLFEHVVNELKARGES